MYPYTAESSSDPFWDSEENETPRMKRIVKILQRQPDAKSIAFFVAKSNNDNFVAYKWTGAEVMPTWISTQNVPAERRERLNLAEELVYGIEQKVNSNGDWTIVMRTEPLKDMVINLTLDDEDHPSLVGPVDNALCILEHAYVQMRKGLVPDVHWVRITGRCVKTGETKTQTIMR